MSYGAEAPAYWEAIPPEERQARGELSSDQCVIDEHFFILGRLELPIVGEPEPFSARARDRGMRSSQLNGSESTPNKSLDRSGGSVFRKMLCAAKGE